MDGILEQILEELKQIKEILSTNNAFLTNDPTNEENNVDQLFESLPEILTAQGIANYLRISRGSVYDLMKLTPAQGGIPNIAIGITKRVEKADFLKWIQEQKKKKVG